MKPKSGSYVTLKDLKRCKMADVYFNAFINIEKYLQNETKDSSARLKVRLVFVKENRVLLNVIISDERRKCSCDFEKQYWPFVCLFILIVFVCTHQPVSSVVKHTLYVGEVWGSISEPVKSAQCRQRFATAASFLRSCVA